jgi:hypothetical protein
VVIEIGGGLRTRRGLAAGADGGQQRQTGYSVAPPPTLDPYERLREHPGWRTHTLGTGHNAMGEAPAQLATVLTG